MTFNTREVTDAEFVNICHENLIRIPIEQMPVWDNFSLACGHKPWKKLVVENDKGEFVAAANLIVFETHGFKYLWAKNAPLYPSSPTPEVEINVAKALQNYIRVNAKEMVLLRLNITDDSLTKAVMRYIPYDTTVVIDTTGDAEEILSRMKPRGRRDVRKAIRETGMECSEESAVAVKDFSTYYAVMQETAERDGFVPHPSEVYKSMLETLGDNCKLFVGRLDGEVVCWALVTVADGVAVQYYAATNHRARKIRCHDQLLFFMCNYFSENGVDKFDLMGIGSEFSPSLLGLNEFKTKFSKEVTKVAPMRDLVCNAKLYMLMTTLRKVNIILRKILRK